MALRDVESLTGLLLVGCHVRDEAPMIAHRVRKAALAGCKVSLLATRVQQCHFPVHQQLVADAASLLPDFAALASGGKRSDAGAAIVKSLSSGRSAIVLGGIAMRHSRFAELRAAAAALASQTGATLGFLPDGGNAVGAALAGALPHRQPGGKPDPEPGLDLRGMLESPLAACLLFGGIEPEHDIGMAGAAQALGACRRIVAITPYADAATMALAQVALPMGTFAETSGSYVNVEGRWQSFNGCAQPVGESRPGWKILRVLGNRLGLAGFDYDTSADVLAELQHSAGTVAYDGRFAGGQAFRAEAGGTTTDVAIYAADAIVRRAPALQMTPAGLAAAGQMG
jgi:NADH-quinone oxidoreductase subunit G